MDTGKPAKTTADYLVIAVSPVLIMVMVHSLCFFLVEVFYRGEGTGGVRWVLFWFVLAVVLITRIGIEQGDWQAMGYGVALALVTWFYLSYEHLNAAFGAGLLATVWFTAHKLTSNCTLIDEDADASGQGLMQSLRRPPDQLKKAAQADKKSVAPLRTEPAPVSPARKKSSPAPGVWLIYYSLAALPLFGLGQTLLPAGDLAARHAGLVYLFFYLAAAAGLLITTSFLGLRRYLRQRYLAMPGNIALGWVQFGVVAAALVLCLSLLLPRPGAGQAWGSLRYHVDHQLRRASEYAARFNPHGSGSGRAGNQPPPAGQPAQPGPGANPNQDQNSGSDGQGKPSQPGSGSDQNGAQGQAGGSQPGRPIPAMSASAHGIYLWLKALFWIVAAAGLVWLLYRYRVLILTLLRGLWASIRDFIAALLGWLPGKAAPAPAGPQVSGARGSRAFKSPFLMGADRVWPAEQLITYSYAALQNWARESEEGSPQTPREFCREVGRELPEAAEALEHLAFLYGHVAYGGTVPVGYDPERLRLLWQYLGSPKPKRAEVPTNSTVAI